MKGFHNSFDRYCNWCNEQAALGLPTMNWGKWWEEIANKEPNEDYNEEKNQCLP